MILKGAVAQVQSRNQSKPTVARRYWRVEILSTFKTGNGADPSLSEIMFKYGTDAPNLAVGGSAAASSRYSSAYSADKAFDGDNNTFWAAAAGQDAYGWVSYIMADAVEVNHVSLRSRPDYWAADQSPKSFKVQSSDDGLTWKDEWDVTDEPPWAIGETRVYNRPAGTP